MKMLTLTNMLLDLDGFERAMSGSPWDRLTDPFVIGCVLAAISVSGGVAWYLAMMQRDRAADGPAFRQLARIAGLNAEQRRLLSELARVAEVERPATLLISAGYFDHIMRTAGGRHVNERRLREVRALLYGSHPAVNP